MSAGYDLAGRGEDLERSVRRLPEPRRRGVEQDLHPVLVQVPLQVARHLGVERRHDLPAALQQRDLEAEADQVLGRLDADEAAADDDRAQLPLERLEARVGVHAGRPAAPLVDPGADLAGVRHRPHAEDAGQVDPRQRRTDGSCSGREHELVVVLGGHLAGRAGP